MNGERGPRCLGHEDLLPAKYCGTLCFPLDLESSRKSNKKIPSLSAVLGFLATFANFVLLTSMIIVTSVRVPGSLNPPPTSVAYRSVHKGFLGFHFR